MEQWARADRTDLRLERAGIYGSHKGRHTEIDCLHNDHSACT